jgi:membrane associated rhomboid family serine protease
MRTLNVSLFVAVFLFVSHLTGRAEAYLDPGTGSMVVQLVVGGLVGALALMKLYWRRLKAFVLRRRAAEDSPFAD